MLELRNALIVPPRTEDGQRYISESGVFTEDGSFVQESSSIVDGQIRHGIPPFPDTSASGYRETFLPGTHAFGGIFYGHFGHFITESTGRLWALDGQADKIDSFIYVPKQMMFKEGDLRNKEQLLAAMGIITKLAVADGPTRVERLLVPTQDFGLDPELIRGTARYREFMRKATLNIVPNGSEKLYVSRETLAPSRGTILGEKVMQDWLRADGYLIFEPQKFSPAEQMAHYRAARRIISVDASPLHLAAYAAHPGQTFSIIKRRSTDAVEKIVSQIESFGESQVQVIDRLEADYTNGKFTRIGRSSWGEVDLELVGRDLKAAGMIDDDSEWRKLTDDELSAQLKELGEKTGSPYRLNPC